MHALRLLLEIGRTCLLAGLFLFSPWLRAETPLVLGIMPFNSTMALIKTHQPLIQHLEARLGRHVTVQTATDYVTFANQLFDHQFDLAIAGPHFGSMARERGATLLFRYRADLQPVFVVRADAPIRSLEDLRGKRIALSSALSMSSIGGVKWLQDHGFVLERDYHLNQFSTHGAAIAAVAVGDMDAALTTHTPIRQVPDDVRQKVRLLPVDIRIPHLMTLADGKLPAREVEQIRAALRTFPETPEGQAFFRDTGYQGYSEVSRADLQSLKPYIDLTVRMLRMGGR